MKKYTTKRVLAGVLAVMTVAGSAPANVGGVLQQFSIIASAADETVDKYTLTWEEGIQDYITSLKVGSTTINLDQVSGDTKLTNIGDVTIVSKVPLKLNDALVDYATLTDAEKKNAKAGTYFKVSGTTTLTYTFAITKDNLDTIKGAPLFEGQTETISLYDLTNYDDPQYEKTDDRYKLKEKTEALIDDVLIQSTKTDVATAAGDFLTNADLYDVVKRTDVTVMIPADKMAQDYTFEVLVYPQNPESTQNRLSAVATYNSKTKNYEATFKMLDEDALIGWRLVEAEKPTYDNKTDPTKLTASGGRIGQATDIAKITAGATRNAEYDELDNVITKEIDIEDGKFASKSSIDYGAGATVTVKFDRDAENTISDVDRTGAELGTMKLTVLKDNNVYQEIEDKYYGKDADLPTFAFTEAGSYKVTATFYVADGNNAVGKDLVFEFTINPYTITADDIALQLFTDEACTAVAENVTPKPVKFKNGKLDIEIPDEVADNQKYYVQLTVPSIILNQYNSYVDAYNEKIDAFNALVEAGTAYRDSQGQTQLTKKADKLSHAKYVSQIEAIPEITAFYVKNGEQYDRVDAVDQIPVETLTNVSAIYTTEGDLDVQTLNSNKEATVVIKAQNYGATNAGTDTNGNAIIKNKDVDVSFKLVRAAQDAKLTVITDSEYDENGILAIAKADANEEYFEKLLWENFEGNATAEANKDNFTFEYHEGTTWTKTNDDMDTREPGIPNTVSDDNYSVYVMLDDEVVEIVYVSIKEYKVKIVPTAASLAPTYGDKLDFSSYKLTDENGNTVKVKINDVKIKSIAKAALNSKGNPYKVDENYAVYDGDEVFDIAALNDGEAYLNAGKYIITFDEAEKDLGADYAVSSDEFILEVGKAALTADMFTIDAINYNGNAQKVAVNNVHFKLNDDIKFDGDDQLEDENTIAFNYYFSITDNTKRTEAGDYTVTIKANDDVKGSKATQYQYQFLNNYSGTAKVDWHIVADDVTETKGNAVGIKWNENETTLVSNAKIALNFQKNANPNLGKDKTGKAITIEKYGVILDKKGVIDALDDTTYNEQQWDGAINPNNGDAAAQKAKAAQIEAANRLQLGNGFTEGSSENIDPELVKKNIYGTNVTVVDAETGIWVRPYALLSDGTVVYGNAVYLDLVHEAMEKLGMKLNKGTKLDGAKSGVGYDADINKFLVYTSYKKLDSTVTAQVYHFGVVVDKKGVFAPYEDTMMGDTTTNKLDELETAYKDAKADYTAAEANFEQNHGVGQGAVTAQQVVDAKDAYDKAKDAYQNYKKILENLKLGNKHTEGNFNPKNPKLESNEYGANIKPINTVTGIWVRGYVDLGNGLVVYTEPQFIEDVSTQYLEGEFAGKLNAQIVTKTGANNQYEVKFVNPVPANSEYEFVKVGAVVDKSEKFVRAAQTDVDAALKGNYYKELVLGKGFNEGGKKTAVQNYTGSITPDTGKLIVARPYVTFKVNDEVGEITVYGEVKLSDKL
jgi:hypothetical protein